MVEEETVVIRLRELREAEGSPRKSWPDGWRSRRRRSRAPNTAGTPTSTLFAATSNRSANELECVAVKKNKRVPIAL